MQNESNAFEKTLDNVQEDPVLRDEVRSSVIDALKGIFDPEISINIYDLGLIYDLKITADGTLHVLMTFTSAWCPFADELLKQVQELTLEAHDKINKVEVVTTMLPQWSKDNVAEEWQLALNF
jgi:metal-sulfur cluster biosynthetic enzyme